MHILSRRSFGSQRSWLSLASVVAAGRASLLERKKVEKKGGGGRRGGRDDDGPSGSVENFDMEPFQTRMNASVNHLTREYSTLRVGQADPALLEGLRVDGKTLKSIAQVARRDASTLTVACYDPSMSDTVSSAIRDADLGFSPTSDGRIILIAIPKATKEFRDKLIKMAAKTAETVKAGIRNARQDALKSLKKLRLPEDDEDRMEKEVQRVHDDFMKKVEKMVKEKEKEIMK